MREFLVFRLSGPMTAFGDITVGERRSVWATPSKSAVLGLLAGALGVVREDAPAHQALEAGLGFAVRADAPGRPLRDYHTAHTPRAQRDVRWRTRRDELADKNELYTVVSERLYHIGAAATVALWRKAEEAPRLEGLGDALNWPRFTPYLGRKACPLGRPPRPRVVEAKGLLAALDTYDDHERQADLALRAWFGPPAIDRRLSVWFEMDAGLSAEENLVRSDGEIRQRRDSLRDRSLWRFSDRSEGRLTWCAPVLGQEDAR